MEYGKFNSADELLKGYNELEKSFTQKCQQLSALEKRLSEISESGTNEISSPQVNEVAQSAAADTVDAVPTPVGADSQREINHAATPPKVMTGGGNVSMALPNRPKTIKEASELAKKYFK